MNGSGRGPGIIEVVPISGPGVSKGRPGFEEGLGEYDLPSRKVEFGTTRVDYPITVEKCESLHRIF